MMSRLTLNVDQAVVERAKRYASERGLSISGLVERYLDDLCRPPANAVDPPILRSLRGTLNQASLDDCRRHLVEKNR